MSEGDDSDDVPTPIEARTAMVLTGNLLLTSYDFSWHFDSPIKVWDLTSGAHLTTIEYAQHPQSTLGGHEFTSI